MAPPAARCHCPFGGHRARGRRVVHCGCNCRLSAGADVASLKRCVFDCSSSTSTRRRCLQLRQRRCIRRCICSNSDSNVRCRATTALCICASPRSSPVRLLVTHVLGSASSRISSRLPLPPDSSSASAIAPQRLHSVASG